MAPAGVEWSVREGVGPVRSGLPATTGTTRGGRPGRGPSGGPTATSSGATSTVSAGCGTGPTRDSSKTPADTRPPPETVWDLPAPPWSARPAPEWKGLRPQLVLRGPLGVPAPVPVTQEEEEERQVELGRLPRRPASPARPLSRPLRRDGAGTGRGAGRLPPQTRGPARVDFARSSMS